ncbi:MAG: hypothetical protein COX65_04130 [Elusimicrobia bacterium CG_4_10_14_0_2_um_filter_56_8]|nr:MAG: hypothetical protein AUJ51_00900 [Elusimicrobia bacterium CG1_02_56_21]PJA15476.1 MAG: hypothetical protein COX65_04130 [Elusimicrobia bacterium CG_4_10_14_0_2_um_filter_56_8]
MKKFTVAAIIALLLGQNPLLIYAVENATVKSVRVSAENVYIDTDRPVQYKAFTTATPPRLVVDLMDSKLKTLQDIPVNGDPLDKVRTGQFQTTPVSISRIVMDLSRITAYEITRKGSELVVMFSAGSGKAAAALKDAPAAVPAGVKVIKPVLSGPVTVTLAAAPIKPSDLNRENTPVISANKRYSAPSSRNIMDSLSREPISFDYNEADVREVIEMMAAKANINIIYGDDVSGTVTISLAKVPFEEAFKTLLNVKGLSTQQVGDNILRIASPATFIAEQKKSMPQTRVFFLNYAKTAEVKAQVEAVALAEGRSAKCTVDENNNALVVTDTVFGLDSTARLIRNLDRIPRQVMIEVKLVEVVLNSTFELGVTWDGATGPNNRALSANVNGTDRSVGFDGISGVFRFGKLTDNSIINAVITASASKGKFKVLSDPKVATLNNKEANITITDQTTYKQETTTIGTSGPTTSTTYPTITSGITLKVTPTINSDGRITMHILPTVSQIGSRPYLDAPPDIATRGTDTNVIVKNGETIVIGGLIHDANTDTVTKVPVLGDIPLLGVLFRKKTNTRTRKELLIFVTPKIIEN